MKDGSLKLISTNGPFSFTTKFDGCGLKVLIADRTVSGNVPSASKTLSTKPNTISTKPNTISNVSVTVPEKKNNIEPVNWSIILPDNKEVKLNGKNWPDWASLGWPEYSGSMKYVSYFNYTFSKKGAILLMPGLHYHAIVSIDGKEVGRIAYKPYELVLSGLNKGQHKLEVTVYNTGANEVVGTIEAEERRYSKRFAHMAAYDRKRLKSGLLGPVSINEMQAGTMT